MTRLRKKYIEWEPAVSPEQIFSDIIVFSEITLDSSCIYWLEMRPSEGGRYVVVKAGLDGTCEDVLPAGYNARTRVHEYGGGSYAAHNGTFYFVNFSDQRIYRQADAASVPVPLTPEQNSDGSTGKYASLTVSPDGSTLLFVYEKEYKERENENFIGTLDTSSGTVSEADILVEGSDFYAEPVFSPDGRSIAWLRWDHPAMPSDSTELILGSFGSGSLSGVKTIDGGKGTSVCFPRFDPSGTLHYVRDQAGADTDVPENWWNIYRYTDRSERITSEHAEFGSPLWVFGQKGYGFLSEGRIAARMLKRDREYLLIISSDGVEDATPNKAISSFGYIQTNDEETVFFIGACAEANPSVYRLDTAGADGLSVIRQGPEPAIEPDDISDPEPIVYGTKDGEQAHAFFYPPKNSRYSPPPDDKPPLLVVAHGGPTSRTGTSFSSIIQFWTSAGFAVVDVNYRGSTGYGRAYRDALLSQWGITDIADVADAVRYIVDAGRGDPDRVAVRGGSAGGYVVQRIMTEYPELIGAGASYYGIGNLMTLAEQTHKFESRYIDNLVGERFSESRTVYRERSPIEHLDRLRSPMIIFQGGEDRIVAPECSREMAEILKQRGITHEYVEYEGEEHGFRSKESNADALEKEFAFYRRVFS